MAQTVEWEAADGGRSFVAILNGKRLRVDRRFASELNAIGYAASVDGKQVGLSKSKTRAKTKAIKAVFQAKPKQQLFSFTEEEEMKPVNRPVPPPLPAGWMEMKPGEEWWKTHGDRVMIVRLAGMMCYSILLDDELQVRDFRGAREDAMERAELLMKEQEAELERQSRIIPPEPSRVLIRMCGPHKGSTTILVGFHFPKELVARYFPDATHVGFHVEDGTVVVTGVCTPNSSKRHPGCYRLRAVEDDPNNRQSIYVYVPRTVLNLSELPPGTTTVLSIVEATVNRVVLSGFGTDWVKSSSVQPEPEPEPAPTPVQEPGPPPTQDELSTGIMFVKHLNDMIRRGVLSVEQKEDRTLRIIIE